MNKLQEKLQRSKNNTQGFQSFCLFDCMLQKLLLKQKEGLTFKMDWLPPDFLHIKP